ncbi:MAG: response regulator [Candidatus Glassbacteria bacterium]|nr:response regulator [Candidatus Glassbacteria bacterium]
MSAKNILIADDEKIILKLLGAIIGQLGHRVTLAEDGLEAAEKILESRRRKDPVDLLITDIRMPGLDGFTLIDKLRTEGVSIPVICMTGYKTRDFIANLKCRDCKHFVIKPFSPLELMDMVKEVLLESGSGDDKKKNSHRPGGGRRSSGCGRRHRQADQGIF